MTTTKEVKTLEEIQRELQTLYELVQWINPRFSALSDGLEPADALWHKIVDATEYLMDFQIHCEEEDLVTKTM